jgi:hypothetical protein
MKLKLALLSSLVALGGSVQAADTSAPDMLSSVSPESVQAMSNAESADARGEYQICSKTARCGWFNSKIDYGVGSYLGGWKIVSKIGPTFGYYSSR